MTGVLRHSRISLGQINYCEGYVRVSQTKKGIQNAVRSFRHRGSVHCAKHPTVPGGVGITIDQHQKGSYVSISVVGN